MNHYPECIHTGWINSFRRGYLRYSILFKWSPCRSCMVRPQGL